MFKNLKLITMLLLITALGIAIYSNSLDCAFHLDDESITKNVLITDAQYIPQLVKDEPQRFVAYLTFMANYRLNKLEVKGYHIVNILIHVLNALLVLFLVSLLVGMREEKDAYLRGNKMTIALLVALLFLAHPVQTQAVTYIVQRLASLATLFYLVALSCYLMVRMKPQRRRRIKIILGLTGLISFGLGMFTKEIIYTLPVMILAIELILFHEGGVKKFIKAMRWYALAGVLLGCWVMWRFDVSKILAPKVTPDFVTITSGQYFLTQLKVMWMYVRILFIPIGLNVEHHVVVAHSLWEPRIIISLLGLLTLGVATMWLVKRNKLAAFGIVWFFVTLSIESTIVPLEDVMFEHRLYLPMVGFVLFAVSILAQITNKHFKSAGMIALLVVVAVFSMMSYRRNKVWKTGITLWEDTIRKSPNKARPYFNLGNAYKRAGQYQTAIAHYTRSIDLAPLYGGAYHGRGIAYRQLGDLQKALDDFNQAVTVEPLKMKFRLNCAETLRRRGMIDEALAEYGRIIQMAPQTVEAYIDRGTIYFQMNKLDEAVVDFNRAAILNPREGIVFNNRGLAYMKKGETEKAFRDISKAIDLNINSALSFYTRGTIYREQKENEMAVKDLTRAIGLKGDYFEAINDRGIVYAEMEMFEEAIADFNETLRINPNFSQAYRNRGIAYGRAGNVEQAQEDLKKAEEMSKH